MVVVNDAGTVSGIPQVDHIFFKYQNGDNRPSPWTPYITGNDGDGAIATANYYLSIHQGVELYPSKQLTEPFLRDIEEVEAGQPGYASPGLTVNCTFNAPGAFWDYLGGGVGAMAEIPGVDEVPWLGLFCAVAGIAIDHLKPVPSTGGASFNDCITDPKSDWPDENAHHFATTDHHLFEMFPHIHGLYKRVHLLKDTWDMTGFVGEVPLDCDSYVRPAGAYGTYKYSF